MDLKELAEQALEYFEQHQRAQPLPGGDPDIFWTLKTYRPVWLKDLSRAVHDDGHFLPDDFKYQTMVDVLNALSEGQEPDDLNLEADIYNHDLLQWLASHLERAGYVDEAVENYGHSDQGVLGDIRQGQWYEKNEIARIMVDGLKEELERIESGEPQEMEGHGEPGQKGPKDWSPKKYKKRGK